MPDRFVQEQRAAMEAVREALAFCQHVQSRSCFLTRRKPDASPVGVGDLGSQALICRALHASFPEDPIVAEEDASPLCSPAGTELLDATLRQLAGSGHSMDPNDLRHWLSLGGGRSFAERFWLVDPVDGTKGFLRGEQYAVSLALLQCGEPVVSVIGCPAFDSDWKCQGGDGTLYVAVRGHGTKAFSIDSATSRPLHVSTIRVSAASRLCESREPRHTSHTLSEALLERLGSDVDPLRIHSQLKYALVAAGAVDVYVRVPAESTVPERTWDHAAGALLVKEAGGRVTDIDGEPLHFTSAVSLESNRGVVATNGLIHDAVLSAWRRI